MSDYDNLGTDAHFDRKMERAMESADLYESIREKHAADLEKGLGLAAVGEPTLSRRAAGLLVSVIDENGFGFADMPRVAEAILRCDKHFMCDGCPYDLSTVLEDEAERLAEAEWEGLI